MKPILFSTDMVKALLANTKTQTRRVIEPQPSEKDRTSSTSLEVYVPARNEAITVRPKYRPGDVLWVRETYGIEQLKGGSPINGAPADPRYIYKATDDIPDDEYHFSGWRPSIHMSKEAARIFLRVTDVRVERLQAISEADAQAEGVEKDSYFAEPTYKTGFCKRWETIYKKRGYGWDVNPLVWVYTLERAGKPDEL